LGLHLRLRALEGKLGVGVLDLGGKAYLVELQVWPLLQMTDVQMPLPSPAIAGDLVIRNLAPLNALIERSDREDRT
jgi:hypothetical protein